MGPEESFGPRVASKLHLPELLPRPVSVEVGRPDEGQVDSQRSAQYIIILMTYITDFKSQSTHYTPVNPTAVDADKDPVSDRGPSRIVAPAVKTHFVCLG